MLLRVQVPPVPWAESLHFCQSAIIAPANSRETVRSQVFPLVLYILTNMSDYTIENRETVVNTLTSRVIENAPLRELIRVYSEAVQAAVAQLSDADVVRSIAAAGYNDILEAFELEVPPAPEASSEAPAEEVVPA